MKKLMLMLVISSLFLGACNKKNNDKISNNNTTTTNTNGIKYRAGSFNAILAKAKTENKPVFIDFYTTWCAPCKWLDQDVLSHESVVEYYNDNFISVKIDAEKGEGPKVAGKYSVYGYPTLVFLDSKGNVIEQQVGMTSISNVLSMAERTVQANNANL